MASAVRSGVVLFALGAAVACSSSAPPDEHVGSTSAAITGSTILSRADEWVQAKLLYCQAPNGQSDTIDPSCPSVCMRESNPAWDPYRSDCSGFVSWAWGLPAPGNTTDEFAPEDTSVSYVIQGDDLEPGDALNIPGDHIVLFVSWVTKGSEANFYEEPGCSANPDYAHAFTSAVTISGSDVTIAYEGATFTAIRFTGLTAGDGGAFDSGAVAPNDSGIGTPCTVTTTGMAGVCLDTTTCAAMAGGVSTPGYCPGPDDVQCCTVPASSGDDAGGGEGTGSGASTAASSGTEGASESNGTSTSAGESHGSVLPGAPSDDAGTAKPATPGEAAEPSSSGGCSVGGSEGDGDSLWLFGIVGLGFVARKRRA